MGSLEGYRDGVTVDSTEGVYVGTTLGEPVGKADGFAKVFF